MASGKVLNFAISNKKLSGDIPDCNLMRGDSQIVGHILHKSMRISVMDLVVVCLIQNKNVKITYNNTSLSSL